MQVDRAGFTCLRWRIDRREAVIFATFMKIYFMNLAGLGLSYAAFSFVPSLCMRSNRRNEVCEVISNVAIGILMFASLIKYSIGTIKNAQANINRHFID